MNYSNATPMVVSDGVGAGVGGFGSWGFIIFFLIILWAFFRRDEDGCDNKDLRYESFKNQAEIEYNSLLETRNAKEAIMAQASAIRNEQQAETIFDLKIENNTLKQNNALLGAVSGIEKQISDCCCGLNRRLDTLECSIPQRPPVYAQGYVPNGIGFPAPVGYGCGL